MENYLSEWSELARMVLAYIMIRFAIQPAYWKANKEEKVWGSWWLYVESLLFAGLVYLLWGRWTIDNLWCVPVAFIVHVLLDGIRLTAEKKYTERSIIFIPEFLLHLLVLTLMWAFEIENNEDIFQNGIDFISKPELWLIVLGYFVVWFPAGYMMRLITLPWQKQLGDAPKGLDNAGRWIGILERTLVLTFVLNNSVSAIGLLIAAKSVLRFGEIRDHENRKEAEYILIGTLLSFSIAIILGLWIRSVLEGGHFPIEEKAG